MTAARKRPTSRNKVRSTVATAIRFDPDLHEKLNQLAEDYGLSVNWLVNRCLRIWWNDFYTGIVAGLGHERIPRPDAEAGVERP